MVLKRTLKVVLVLVVVFGIFLTVHAQGSGLASINITLQDDVQAKIENAMSAAIPSISENATILDNELDESGEFVVLREGTNGWFCFPDLPTTPGNDPSCNDQTWMDWTYAFLAGEEPDVTVLGVAYMLQGGSDASNTDPFATEPPEGEDWINTAPHIMLLVPDGLFESGLTNDHLSGQHWVMWAGTPYEHIMIPVVEGEHGHSE
jgi:hypothetical protein